MSKITIENGYLYKDGMAYANVKTKDSLVQKMISKVYEGVFGFEYIAHNSEVDPNLRVALKGTIWARVPFVDKVQGKDYSIVREQKTINA